MKKSSAFEWHRRFKEGREDMQDTQEVGSQKRIGQMQCGQSTNLGALRLKIRFETNSRRIEYE
jgi:hypothetical protein